jgi:hypothetical protein
MNEKVGAMCYVLCGLPAVTAVTTTAAATVTAAAVVIKVLFVQHLKSYIIHTPQQLKGHRTARRAPSTTVCVCVLLVAHNT